MSEILLIGATGLLGKSLSNHFDCVDTKTRFEDKQGWDRLFNENNFHTIFHVARSCRVNQPRRDFNTMQQELHGMINILEAGGKNCRFVYASTKVMYGLTNESVHPMSADDFVPYYQQALQDNYKNKIANIPDVDFTSLPWSNLSTHHRIYAETKQACENLVKNACKNFTIFRIWDIY